MIRLKFAKKLVGMLGNFEFLVDRNDQNLSLGRLGIDFPDKI